MLHYMPATISDAVLLSEVHVISGSYLTMQCLDHGVLFIPLFLHVLCTYNKQRESNSLERMLMNTC